MICSVIVPVPLETTTVRPCSVIIGWIRFDLDLAAFGSVGCRAALFGLTVTGGTALRQSGCCCRVSSAAESRLYSRILLVGSPLLLRQPPPWLTSQQVAQRCQDAASSVISFQTCSDYHHHSLFVAQHQAGLHLGFCFAS